MVNPLPKYNSFLKPSPTEAFVFLKDSNFLECNAVPMDLTAGSNNPIAVIFRIKQSKSLPNNKASDHRITKSSAVPL